MISNKYEQGFIDNAGESLLRAPAGLCATGDDATVWHPWIGVVAVSPIVLATDCGCSSIDTGCWIDDGSLSSISTGSSIVDGS